MTADPAAGEIQMKRAHWIVRHGALCLGLAQALVAAGCVGCAQPSSAASDPADSLARCEQLYGLYQRYRSTGGESSQGSSFQGQLEAEEALATCRRGNTRAGIAALERKVGGGGACP